MSDEQRGKLYLLPPVRKPAAPDDLVPESDWRDIAACLEAWLRLVQAGRVATLGIAAETHDGAAQWEWCGAEPSSGMVAAADVLHFQVRNAMLACAEDVDEMPGK